MSQAAGESFGDELTPTRIWEAIRRLVAARPEMKRSGVTAFELVDALLGPQASGPEAWRAREAFKARLVQTLGDMPGLAYVEGDS
jgi:hypothetical protein